MDALPTLSSALAGRYTVDREIGRGGMATVYLARDIRHDRRVALKVLSPELGAVLGVERFLAEIRVTANLQHPNLLPLFDSGEADGLLFYVMPYVDGESLRARLEREKQLPVAEAVRMATAVASALDYAHRHGVIHRDLKPENILLHESQPLVADFGIALAVSNAGGNRITQTGISLGTPQYMSPEQATGDRQIDGRSDIYSLAAVLYEMLTGDPPHFGSTSQAIIARVLTEKPRSMRATRETIPSHVDAAVERALAKLPADRWATAQEFAEALNNQRAVPVTAPITSSVELPAPHARATGRDRLRRAALWVLPVLGVGIGAVLMAWFQRPREPSGLTVRYPLNFAPDERAGDAQGAPFALSPDGKMLVYVGSKAGRRGLFLRNLSELSARQLPATDDGMQPFFSPDGQWIGFLSRTQLKKMPVQGGTAITLAEAQSVWGANWYRDDQLVISTRGKLATVSTAGGTPRVFLTQDTSAHESSFRFPLVLSDGKTVLFSVVSEGGVNAARIGAVSIDGSGKRIFDLVGTHPLAVLDGKLIFASTTGAIMAVSFDERRVAPTGTPVPVINDAFVGPSGPLKGSVSRSGSLVYMTGSSTREVVLAERGGASSPLIAQPAQYARPRFSPDGRYLAIEVSSGAATEISIFDMASGTLASLTSDGSINANPEWTPDGKRVIYSSQREGRIGLWWQPADRSGAAERLIKADSVVYHEGLLSRDGSTLVVRVDGMRTTNDIWYRGMTGDTTMKRLVSSSFNEGGPRISPDGHWVAFTSDESGFNQVYVTPLPGPGGRYPVTKDGGTMPVWSRDGRQLFYGHGQRLESATLSFAPTFSVTARDTALNITVPSAPGHAIYDVAPDGKHFVILKQSGGDPQLIVVHDWKYELRARLGRVAR